MAPPSPLLIVFGGRPGTGKTTLSRELARKLAAAYLRIDTIEQNLKAAGFSVGAMGYTIANALAAENLRLDRVVIVDCVNPVSASRNGWRETALRSSARLVEIEIICSDEVEHRNRVEGRVVDIEGLMLPSWSEVINRPYEPWDRDRFVLDTATRSIDSLVDDLEAHVGHELAWRSRDV
jgi:predicted kinase